MCKNNQWLCRQQGFTLVEVMIALFIFMVIALGLAQGELAALRAHTDNLFRDEAIRVAEDELNNVRNNLPALASRLGAGWTALPIQSAEIRGAAVEFVPWYQIANTGAGVVTLTRIDIVVGWNQGNNPALLLPVGLNRNHQVSLSTIQQQ